MEYIVGDYSISLEPSLGRLFSFTVKDNRDFSTYKGNMPFKLFAKDKEQFKAVMKKFFEGAYLMKIEEDYTLKIEKYVFQIEKDANGLNFLFKLVVDEIVMKEFTLQLPLFPTMSLADAREAAFNALPGKATLRISNLDAAVSAITEISAAAKRETAITRRVCDALLELFIVAKQRTFCEISTPSIHSHPFE